MSKNEILTRQEQPTSFVEFVDPFPGLRPFGIEESHLFFGREGQSDEVLMKLADNKFVGILGASGSGKSSLMYCGLIPTLYGGFMTQAGSNWRIVVTRPGGGPIENLAEALLSKNKEYHDLEEEEQLIRKTITSTVLRSSSLGLIEVVKQLKSADNENVLVLVDQFEELFRYKKFETLSSDLDESSAFVNLLLEAAHQYDAPIYVALTMRSDFIGDCALYPDLTQMINDSHYLIPQMTRDQKRLAIEGPVAVGGGNIAPRLTQQLLNDVGDNPDQLPILQHALMRTWQYWKEYRNEQEPMDLKHYNAIGTLREALSQHANEAYDSLSKREQQICESMFKALTERGTESSGIRRPTKLSSIAAIAGVNEEEVARIVEKFREPGRTLLMPPYGVPINSDTVIDISHESLMRIWTRMKSWLDEEARSAAMYLKLSESAENFQLGRSGLWKMPDLQLALNWQEENKPTLVWGQRYEPAFERTMVFLDTSKKAYETEQRNKEFLQKRALKRSRVLAIAMGVAALICIFFVVMAQIKASEADKQKILAQQHLKTAEENADKAKAEELKAVKAAANARIAQRKAEEEKKKANAARTQANLEKDRANVQTALALKATALAKENEKLANKNAETARLATLEANKSAETARLATLEANKSAAEARLEKQNALALRYQAIANSMAIKSKSIEENVEEKALIALQAWKFEKEYGAKEYNADIYAGVYYAYRDLSDRDTMSVSNFNHYGGYDVKNDTVKFGHAIGEAVRSVLYTKNGEKMYSASSDGRIIAWDMTNNKKQGKVIVKNDIVNRVVDMSYDEKYIAVGSDKEEILLFNMLSNAVIPIKMKGHQGTVYDLVFLKDKNGFISTSGDRVIRMSDYKRSKRIATTDERVKSIALNPTGNLLAGGSIDGNIYLWKLDSNNYQRKFHVRKGTAVHALAFSHDGFRLAIGDEKGSVILWDLNEKRAIRRLSGHTSKITSLEFSPDNSLLASTSWDGTARLWSMQDLNDLPIKLDDHGHGRGNNNWVWSATFAPDGQSLMTGAGDGIIRYWPTHPDEMAKTICENQLVQHNLSLNSWKAYVGEDIDYKETCEGKPQMYDNL